MKKRNRAERKKAFKEAYYNELKKINIIDTPKEEKPKKVVKKSTTKKEDK